MSNSNTNQHVQHVESVATNLQSTCNQLATDTISRQAAIDAFGLSEKTRKYGGDHSGYDTRMLYEIQNVLEGLPSADVVEVVRCKDCFWSREIIAYGIKTLTCNNENGLFRDVVGSDFCTCAERRNDEP